MKRNFYIGAIFLALVAALAAGSVMLEKKTTAEGAEVLAPRFEVDPLWPKPLPNHWVQGMSVGVSVDPGTTSGSFTARIPSSRWKSTQARSRPRRSAASRLRRFSSSTKRATSSVTGEARARAMTGRIRITASPWITKATYGLGGTAAAKTAHAFTTIKF